MTLGGNAQNIVLIQMYIDCRHGVYVARVYQEEFPYAHILYINLLCRRSACLQSQHTYYNDYEYVPHC
jgi:hypothetical protein